jgi:hypothetical protein
MHVAVIGGARDAPSPPRRIAGLDVRETKLKPGAPDTWEQALEAAVSADPAPVKVIWAADPRLAQTVWNLVRDRDDRLAVTTELAAEGAAAALRRGESPASLVYPPLASPRRALEQAGLASQDGARCRVDLTQETSGPWLRFTPEGIAVRADQLTPMERRAAAEREGPRRPESGHLLIGRCNYSGQGRNWAQAVEDNVPGFTAANIAMRTAGRPREFPADHFALGHEFAELMTRLDLALEFGAPATHVLMEDLVPVFGATHARSVNAYLSRARAELDLLMESGRGVGVLVHGSAGRSPRTHAALYPWSPFRDLGSPLSVAETERADGVAELAEALRGAGVPLFAATPDMLDYLPGAVWLPIVPARAAFAPAPPWAPGARPRVAHIPSSDVKKGSDWADPVLRRLDAAGVIEYISLRDVAATRMPQVLRDVDVVVDQVVLGNPATLLIETMAAGRLAVANVAAPVRRRFPEPLPVVEADPLTLGEAVADIAADPDRYRALAQAGPAFARRYHDGRLSADVLARHFLTPGLGAET